MGDQALSEMYGRPIHIYCYSQEPINIFQHIQNRPGVESELNIPIRLCYHRGVHYNSLTDPNNVNLGVGLGLPGLKPGIENKALVANALINRDNILTEQQMMEDKIKATDWEATNEAIEEQGPGSPTCSGWRSKRSRRKTRRILQLQQSPVARSPQEEAPRPGEGLVLALYSLPSLPHGLGQYQARPLQRRDVAANLILFRVETVPNLEEAATNKFEAAPHLLWEDSTFNRLHPF